MTGKKPRKITETYLHNAGLYYLQRYAASTAQFRQVMTRKIDRSCQIHMEQNRADCQALLETLIEKFVRSGLLNDAVYLEGAASSLRKRGLSARVIENKLQMKGLPSEQIRLTLSRIDEENGSDDLIAALRHARKKRLGPYSSSPAPDADKKEKKDLSSLARAGFSFDIARKILSLNREEAEDLLTVHPLRQ